MTDAVVAKKILGVMRFRRGRGFSLSELKECGLTIPDARKKGLRVDKLRRTKHEENIKALKAWLESQPKPKPEGSTTDQVEEPLK